MNNLKPGIDWINERYDAGAQRIGVTCDEHTRRVFLTADGETLILTVKVGRHAKTIKAFIHEYIRRLPRRSVQP